MHKAALFWTACPSDSTEFWKTESTRVLHWMSISTHPIPWSSSGYSDQAPLDIWILEVALDGWNNTGRQTERVNSLGQSLPRFDRPLKNNVRLVTINDLQLSSALLSSHHICLE